MEASFSVGGIVILSATRSDGLETWLAGRIAFPRNAASRPSRPVE